MKNTLLGIGAFFAGVLGVCVGFAVYMMELMGRSTDE